jgi:hypothetical protein
VEEFCKIGMKVNELVPEDQRTTQQPVLLLENTWQPSAYAVVAISFAAGVIFTASVYKYLTE